MIDFKQEALKRKDNIIADLQQLCQINSELTEFCPQNKEAPFGDGLKKALDKMIEIGKREGFSVFNDDNYAMHLEYGNNKTYVAAIGHLDVVPATGKWTYDPYSATVVGDLMFGRGTEDDKSGIIASLYAMIILRDLGITLKHNLRLICGCDEETLWRCMDHYYQDREAPVAGFVPDSGFPACYAEKGIASISITGDFDNSKVVMLEGGSKDNMVPDIAKAKIKELGITKEFNKFCENTPYSGEIVEDGEYSLITVKGISAHGAGPQNGLNAIFGLVKFLNQIGISNELIDFINDYLLDDFIGTNLGIVANTPDLGQTTVNTGVLTTKDNKYTLYLNPRYPENVVFSDMIAQIQKCASEYNASVEVIKNLDYVYYDVNSPLIKTLMDVFKKHTNSDALPYTMGGGTFARVTKNIVAYGPGLGHSMNRAHQIDEACSISDLLDAVAIYAEAFYELAK